MLPIFAMLSEWHIILLLVVVLLLFGGKKLPELARGLGEAIREFTKSKRDITTNDPCQPPATPPAEPLLTPPAEPPAKPTPTPSVPQKPDDPKLN
jgi:sec-independent protein translocase protein TatA